MKRDSWKVLSKRPRLVHGSKQQEWHTEVKYPCIYCGAELGEEHNPECAHREQTVVVDVTIRMDIQSIIRIAKKQTKPILVKFPCGCCV